MYFCKPEVTYLDHVVSRNGIKPDPSKISAVELEHFPKPVNIKTLPTFLGLSSYYRKFIPEFANIASPLLKLLQKNHRFSWDVHCENAFHMLKKHFTNPPVMCYPDFEQPFEVQCDASDSGIASILSQNGRVISYASRTLQKHDKNYSTIEKECLAVIWSIKYFKYYLGGHKFTILRSSAFKMVAKHEEPCKQSPSTLVYVPTCTRVRLYHIPHSWKIEL